MADRRVALANRRKAVGLSQRALARLLDVDETSIRHWEAGRHPPLPHIRPAMAEHLRLSLDELDRMLNGADEPADTASPTAVDENGFELIHSKLTARLYQSQSTMPQEPLALMLPDGSAIPVGIDDFGHELDALLLAPLGQWAALDNRVGPSRLRRLVTDHFSVVDAFLDDARGSDFQRLAYIAARHGEFAGWLAQDSGDLPAAMRWTDTALECARLIGDRQLESYILMRKSNIATDQHRQDLAIALADAAWHSSTPQSGPLKALALRQRAHALTAAHDAAGALRSVDQARDMLTGPDDGSTDLTGYCTLPYLDMESAACLVDLGQPEDAIPILEQGLRSWSPEFRRDLGLCLARLGLAYARIREPATAAAIAVQSARIARATGSERTVRVLGQVGGALQEAGHHDRAREVQGALASPSTNT